MVVNKDNETIIKEIDRMLGNPSLNSTMRKKLLKKKNILLNNKTINK